MARSLAASIRAALTATYTNAQDLSTPSDALSLTGTNTFTNGTGANQANVVWHDQRTLSSTTSEDLDLAASLASTLGGTITFTAIKAIYIEVTTTTASTVVEIGAASANQFIGPLKHSSDIASIGGGGVFLVSSPVDGWTVTAGTGDLLKINNTSAHSATYKIVIVGIGTVA